MSSTTEVSLESATCPICGPSATAISSYEFDPYKIVVCASCGLRYLSPRLTEEAILQHYQGEEYYRSNTSGQGYDEYLEIGDNWVRTFSRRLRELAPFLRSGRVLDVGCGPGYFLTAAQKMGFDVYGIDPSEYIVKRASGQWGDRIQRGLIETANYESDSFDLVVAFDTFEHVYDPKRFLTAVHRVLKPGGIIAITTPDPTSLLARISGRGWVSYKIPEHVFYWAPETIRRILSDRFEVLEIRRAGQYATLGFLFRRVFRVGASPGPMLRAVLRCLNRFSLYSDNGSLTVFARKKPSN